MAVVNSEARMSEVNRNMFRSPSVMLAVTRRRSVLPYHENNKHGDVNAPLCFEKITPKLASVASSTHAPFNVANDIISQYKVQSEIAKFFVVFLRRSRQRGYPPDLIDARSRVGYLHLVPV